MSIITHALGKNVRQGPAVSGKLRHLYGRPARRLSHVQLDQSLRTLKEAFKEYQNAMWYKAIALFEKVRRQLGQDQWSISRKPHVFKALQRARVQLSVCYLRAGKGRLAWEAMEEALLAQPSLSTSVVLHGPQLHRLFLRVKRQLDLQLSTLTVTTNPPGGFVFLSGRNVGVSPITIKQLYQGIYDVMVLWRGHTSRIRRIIVGLRPVHLRIDRFTERAVRTSRYAGLYLPEGPDRKILESRLASKLGLELDADTVILVGVRLIRGRQAILGQVIKTKHGRQSVQAHVFIDRSNPKDATLRRLARFLLRGGSPGQGIIVVGSSERPGERRIRGPGSGHGHRRWLMITGWTMAPIGLAGLVGGAILAGLSGTKRKSTDPLYRYEQLDTFKLGFSILGVGGALMVAGVIMLAYHYLDISSSRRGQAAERQPGLLLTSSGRTTLVGLQGRF